MNNEKIGILAADTTLSIWDEIILYSEHSQSRVQWKHFSNLQVFTIDTLKYYMEEYFGYKLTTEDIKEAKKFLPVRGVVFMEDFFTILCAHVLTNSSSKSIKQHFNDALKNGINMAQARFRVIIKRMINNTKNSDSSQNQTVSQLIDKIYCGIMFEDGDLY